MRTTDIMFISTTVKLLLMTSEKMICGILIIVYHYLPLNEFCLSTKNCNT